MSNIRRYSSGAGSERTWWFFAPSAWFAGRVIFYVYYLHRHQAIGFTGEVRVIRSQLLNNKSTPPQSRLCDNYLRLTLKYLRGIAFLANDRSRCHPLGCIEVLLLLVKDSISSVRCNSCSSMLVVIGGRLLGCQMLLNNRLILSRAIIRVTTAKRAVGIPSVR